MVIKPFFLQKKYRLKLEMKQSADWIYHRRLRGKSSAVEEWTKSELFDWIKNVIVEKSKHESDSHPHQSDRFIHNLLWSTTYQCSHYTRVHRNWNLDKLGIVNPPCNVDQFSPLLALLLSKDFCPPWSRSLRPPASTPEVWSPPET